MKKIVCIFVTLFVFLQGTAAFAISYHATPIDYNDEPMIPESNPPGLVDINGITYISSGEATSLEPIEYSAEVYDFMKPGYEYIWTGQYFYVRSTAGKYAPTQYLKDPIFGYIKPIKLYDRNFNLVKEHQFDTYVYDIAYYNGTYYCRLGDSNAKYLKSTDFENWEIEENNILTQVGNTVHKFSEGRKWVSIGDQEFRPLEYEGNKKGFSYRFGEWVVSVDTSRRIFRLSNDAIYYVEITCGNEVENTFKNLFVPNYIYENGDDLIIDTLDPLGRSKGYRCTVPKQPVYDALEAQKSAPYVCVNNTILGFETPPVTESDRTLVPMRFLFEQLGAEVTWDEATETATAKKANTTINFAIDNTTATVNGAETVMDVPARLVGDKTMVPLRFLSEEMGYNVEWDEETRMATITTPLVSRMEKAEITDVFGEWIR